MSIPDDPKVAKLRHGAARLDDIPAMLRQMAVMIERGEHVGDSAIFILVNESAEEEDWPEIFGWGEALGDYQMIGLLDMCKTWFVVNKTKRFT